LENLDIYEEIINLNEYEYGKYNNIDFNDNDLIELLRI